MSGIKRKLFLVYTLLILVLSIFAFIVYKATILKKSTGIVYLNKSALDVHRFIVSCENNTHNFILFLSLDCDHCTDAIAFLKQQKNKLTMGNSFILVFNENELAIKKFITLNSDWINTKGVAIYNDDEKRLFSALNVSYYPALFEINAKEIISRGNGLTGLKKMLDLK